VHGSRPTGKGAAIDYQFAAGHRMRLVLATTDFAYATGSAAAVYRVALAGHGVVIPSDPALVIVNGGLPWWTWAAPAAALLLNHSSWVVTHTCEYCGGVLPVSDTSVRAEHAASRQTSSTSGPESADGR